jgi:hypothetical protein
VKSDWKSQEIDTFETHTDTHFRIVHPEPMSGFTEYAPTGAAWHIPLVPKARPILREGNQVTGLGRRKRAVANVRLNDHLCGQITGILILHGPDSNSQAFFFFG